MKASVIRSTTRKTVTIHIRDHETIIVKAPVRFPTEKIKQLLKQNEAWIKQKQQAFLTRSAIKNDHTYWYLGKTYQIATRMQQKQVIELEDKLYIAIANKKSMTTYLTSWYKQQARKIIGERVLLYAQAAGLSYQSVAITSAETRWGSCSSKKTLNFNWKLVMAPLEVIDYVVSHELAHLTEMNHSRDFWEQIRKIYPVYRQYRTWIKRYGHLLTIEQ